MERDLKRGKVVDLVLDVDWSWELQFASVRACSGSVRNWLKVLSSGVILLLNIIPKWDVCLTHLIAYLAVSICFLVGRFRYRANMAVIVDRSGRVPWASQFRESASKRMYATS